MFSSNADLYAYLTGLRQTLADRSANTLAEVVGTAFSFASGMSTEFLGESRIALRTLAQAEDNPLTQSERQLLAQAISELDDAFARR